MAVDGTSVGSLHYDLNIDDSNLQGQLNKADKNVQDFGGSVNDAGDKLKSNLNKAAAGFAIVGAGLGLVDKQAVDFTTNLVKSSAGLGREIGVSTQEASRLTAALSRMGVASEDSAAMFGIFSKNVVASTANAEQNRLATEKLQLQINDTKRAITDTTLEIKLHGDKTGDLNAKIKTLNNTLASEQDALNQSVDGFAKLGVTTIDATGKQKDFETLLFEIADKFKDLPNGIDKTALSMQLFGRQGKDIVKVLNLGSDGIKDLEKKADELGLTLNANTIGKINELIQSQKNLKEQTDSLKISIGTATAPILTDFNRILVSVATDLLGTDSPLRGITASFLAFAPPVFTGAATLFSFASNVVQVGQAFPGATAGLVSFGAAALPVIGTVGLLAAGFVAVHLALNSVADAWGAVNNAASAAESLGNDAQIIQLQKQAKTYRDAGKAVPKSIINAIAANAGGAASGVENWKGGLTWVNEQGPELINLPNGSQVIPNQLSEKIVKDSNNQTSTKTVFNIGTINDKSDADYIMRRADRNQQRLAMGMSQA